MDTLDKQIEEILNKFTAPRNVKGDSGEYYDFTFQEAKSKLTKLIQEAKIEELERLSMEVIEPCEPECDEVRHALHEGSWNAHLKLEARIAELKQE